MVYSNKKINVLSKRQSQAVNALDMASDSNQSVCFEAISFTVQFCPGKNK